MNRDKLTAGEPNAPLDSTEGFGVSAAHTRQIEQLFRQHNEALLRFLIARTGSPQEAKDVAQEAYVKLLGLDRPDTVGYLRAYLFETAANLAKDRLKQRTRREHIDPLVFFEEAPASPSPEPLWIARERLALISQAIQQLPPLCRAAFILRKFDELSVEQVAAQLNISSRSVKRHIARALSFCDQVLASADNELSK